MTTTNPHFRTAISSGSVNNPGAAPALSCTELGKEFERRGQKTEVFSDIRLQIERGEFVVIVGPSGCGKSTLLRLFAGLEQASRGTIERNGPDPRNPPRVSVVFQEDSLFPWMRTIDNVTIGLRARRESKKTRRERGQKELEQVKLNSAANQFPSELSGGMRQRVNLARAMANDPDTLLMDEPFAALDVQTKSALQVQLLDIWERNRRTVLFVTHSIQEALLLADRIIVMGRDPGRIIAERPVPFERPRSADTLRFTEAFNQLEQELWMLLEAEHQRTSEGQGSTT